MSPGSPPTTESARSSARWEPAPKTTVGHDRSNERLRMSQILFFEQLQVGDVWASPRRTVTETDVVNFAGMTGDYDPLHVDHEFAQQTPYRRPIAHGLLGLAFVAGLGSNAPQVRTLAFVSIQQWEFRQPMFIGDTVYARTEVLEKRPGGRRCGNVLWKRELVNQAGSVVQRGVFETLVALAQPLGSKRQPSPVSPNTRRGAASEESDSSDSL